MERLTIEQKTLQEITSSLEKTSLLKSKGQHGSALGTSWVNIEVTSYDNTLQYSISAAETLAWCFHILSSWSKGNKHVFRWSGVSETCKEIIYREKYDLCISEALHGNTQFSEVFYVLLRLLRIQIQINWDLVVKRSIRDTLPSGMSYSFLRGCCGVSAWCIIT